MKLNTVLTILTAIIALLVLNFLAARHPLKLDLTQDRVYTLSDSTARIVEELDDVVTVRVYFSNDLPPALLGVRRDVEDLLAEFKGAAGDKFQVEHIDPSASAGEQERLALMGILPVQYNLYQGDRVEVASVYLGIAVMHGGRQEILPVVHNTASLEYQLTEAIIKVSSESMPAIGWWEYKNPEDEISPYSIVRQALERRYEVVEIGGDEIVDLDPARLKAIVLLSPRNISQDDLFALDQYLIRGGRLMALLDRWDVETKLSLAPVETSAIDLISHYGATVEDALVADESNAMAAFTGGMVTYHVPYPFWPEVRSGGFMRDQPIAVNIESAIFPWTAPVALTGDGMRETAVAVSTMQATAVKAQGVDLEPRQASDELTASDRKQQTIAALIEGPFTSYFAGTGETPPRGAAVVAEGLPESRIFVTGSSRWIMDKFLQNFPQNAALFENALDFLAMSELLIGIRSRASARRPIALMPVGAAAFLRYANVVAGPLALGMIGTGVFVADKRRRRRIAKRYRRKA